MKMKNYLIAKTGNKKVIFTYNDKNLYHGTFFEKENFHHNFYNKENLSDVIILAKKFGLKFDNLKVK